MSEEVLQSFAERQHGVVAAWQVGGDVRRICRRSSKHWELMTPVVLRRRGSPRTWEQRVAAGVLDAGDGAFASHRTAAALWELPGFGVGEIEVSRVGRRTSRQSTVAYVHRPRLVLPHHVTEVRGIPVGSIARTLFDLAGVGIREDRIGRLVNLVSNRSPGTLVALHRALDELAGKGRGGITVMRSVLADRPVGSVLPASGLEQRFASLVTEAGLGPFRRQVDLGGHGWIGRVDFVDEHGVVVEVDSVLHHSSPEDRARDSARDSALVAAGFRSVVRVAEEQLWHRPYEVVAQLHEVRRSLLLGAKEATSG